MELLMAVALFFFVGWCFGKIGRWLEGIGKDMAKKEAAQALYQRELLSSVQALDSALVPREESVSVRLAKAQKILEDKKGTRKQIDALCNTWKGS